MIFVGTSRRLSGAVGLTYGYYNYNIPIAEATRDCTDDFAEILAIV